MSNNELLKTIEAQGKLITELRAENEQLKWEIGSTLVDLREENELLRSELEDIRILSRKLVEYNYDAEEHDYDCYEDNEKPQSHVFLVIKELDNLLQPQNQ